MDPISFAVTVLALLATPGPTNTLLAASGAGTGVRRSLRLVPAEVCGYLVSIMVITGVFGDAIASRPAAAAGLKLAASLWLIYCAVRLWRQAGQGFGMADTAVTMRQVFVTTAFNPKAPIFALVIIPSGGIAEVAPWLAGFSGLTAGVAMLWIAFGAVVARSSGGLATPDRIWRVAALGLAAFATVIAGSAIAAVS